MSGFNLASGWLKGAGCADKTSLKGTPDVMLNFQSLGHGLLVDYKLDCVNQYVDNTKTPRLSWGILLCGHMKK